MLQKWIRARENFWVDVALAALTIGTFITFLVLDKPVTAVVLYVVGLAAMLTHGTYWTYRGRQR